MGDTKQYQNQGLEIAHITIDGKEIDKTTNIDNKKVTTQKSSDVLSMYLNKKPMFIKFYATWCGHCVSMDGEWKKLIEETKKKYNNKNIAIVEVESQVISKEKYKEIDELISKTKGLKKVNGFPTIGSITYDNNKNAVFTPYNGNRTVGEMFKAVSTLVQDKHTMKGGHRTKKSLKQKYRAKTKAKTKTKTKTKTKSKTKSKKRRIQAHKTRHSRY